MVPATSKRFGTRATLSHETTRVNDQDQTEPCRPQENIPSLNPPCSQEHLTPIGISKRGELFHLRKEALPRPLPAATLCENYMQPSVQCA